MSWLDAPKSEHEVRREHFVAGVETERERIIALLQTEIFADENDENATIFDVYLNKLIALIKGENK